MTAASLTAETARWGLRWRVSIGTALTVGFGVLIVAAVGSVLFFGLQSALRNTQDLVADKTILIVESVAERVRQHLRPPREQVEYLASLVDGEVFDPADRNALMSYLAASLAAAPQVNDIMYIDNRLQAVEVHRSSGQVDLIVRDLSDFAPALAGIDLLRRAEEPVWGEPIYVPEIADTVVKVRAPVRRDGVFLGGFVASVRVGGLSEYLSRLSTSSGEVAFILFGPDKVLAHPRLAGRVLDLSQDEPLPTLADIDDPVLRSIWDDTDEIRPIDQVDTHLVQVKESEDYVFVYRRLYGVGATPWIVGCYFHIEDIGAGFKRLKKAAMGGLAILLLAIMSALVIGTWISRPVRRLAVAADGLREHGPHHVAQLPRSRLVELDSAGAAFNEMAEGLREREMIRETFGKYVPQSIAGAILEDRGILQPQTRLATILFTDIVGFSGIAEIMAPEQLIAMLNDYFSVVIGPIERNGGVIHQFQGDAILATYNLPVEDPEHAVKAVRTAIEIQQVLAEHTFADGVALATRVGINTGTMVGGTVGAGGRLGYKVHGDDVNLAAQIEQLNKKYGSLILVSQSTVDLASAAFTFERIGKVTIRGRVRSAVIYRVIGPHSVFERSRPASEAKSSVRQAF